MEAEDGSQALSDFIAPPLARSDSGDVIERSTSALYFQTTPELLLELDNRMPGHRYQIKFPSNLITDPIHGLTDLKSLMRGIKVYHTPKAPRPVNADYEARMQALRDRLEEQSYQSLVQDTAHSALADTRSELRELKNQLSTVINVLISIFTAAMASWYWTPSWPVGSRVLASLGSAIGLGAIEAFLYFRYLAKIQQSNQREAKIKSRSRAKQTKSSDPKAAVQAKKDQ